MGEKEKILGEERRDLILQVLKQSDSPVTGRELGAMTNVSRQVIVGDITLLKAKNEPIVATSQGYVYLHADGASATFEKTIVCQHTSEQTEEELNILVDHGVTVKDVKIEHPVYGDLVASVMVSNRSEVKAFLKNIEISNAVFLLKLTEGGIHLHTIEAKAEEDILAAEDALRGAGILVE